MTGGWTAAIFIGGLTEPVTSLAGAAGAAGGPADWVVSAGEIRLAVGVGGTSASAADCRVDAGSGTGAAGSAVAGAGSGGATGVGAAILRASGACVWPGATRGGSCAPSEPLIMLTTCMVP